jgi:hypothetical protein
VAYGARGSCFADYLNAIFIDGWRALAAAVIAHHQVAVAVQAYGCAAILAGHSLRIGRRPEILQGPVRSQQEIALPVSAVLTGLTRTRQTWFRLDWFLALLPMLELESQKSYLNRCLTTHSHYSVIFVPP